MATNTSPWRKPGAQALFDMLGGDPKRDTVLTSVVESVDSLTLELLAGMVGTALATARADAFERGYREAGGRP